MEDVQQRRRIDVSLPVALEGCAATLALAATVYVPVRPTPGTPVLFLLPGAGFNRHYFDLQLAPLAGYSEVEHHLARDFIIVTMDHLAVGDSSLPDDAELIFPLKGAARDRPRLPFSLTFETMASACDQAAKAVLRGLNDGTIDSQTPPLRTGTSIALGQSMGGHVVVATQAYHETFDAIGALGTSFTQTRLSLRAGARYPFRSTSPDALIRAAQTESDMTAAFHWPDEPAGVVAADMAPEMDAPWRSEAIPGCSARGLVPGGFAQEAGAIRVPMLLAYGEVDVSPDPNAEVVAFRSCSDITLTIIPEMAHMHNFASTRARLWRRIDDFVRAAAETAIE